VRRANLSPFAQLIGGAAVLVFLFLTILLAWPRGETGPSQISIFMLGNLTGFAAAVFLFCYGSSDGSKAKDPQPPTPQ